MNLLLDTHAFVWALFSPEHLSSLTHQLLRERQDALVSAVSLYEIAAKVRLGKWPEAEPLLSYEIDFFEQQGFRFVDLTPKIAVRAGRMPGEHRDPFDRFIAATCIELDLTVLSTDAALDSFGVRRVW